MRQDPLGPASKALPGPTRVRNHYHSCLMFLAHRLALLDTPDWGHCVCVWRHLTPGGRDVEGKPRILSLDPRRSR